jgi:hypothetical protein
LIAAAGLPEPVVPFRHARGPDEDPKVDVSSDGRVFRYGYADGTAFVIDAVEHRVWGWTPPGQTIEDTAVYLIGPVLGFLARVRGVLCLHASAVVLGDMAIAFVGPAGQGKSTLAAAFATAGVPVLTDDIAALTPTHDGHAVEPGSSQVRLWPESTPVTADDRELPRIAPDWDKRYVDLTRGPYSFAERAVSLDTVYLLEDAGQSPPFIRGLSEADAILSLVGNTYANYMLTPRQRAEELFAIGSLVDRVPIRTLGVPAGLDALPSVIEAVRGASLQPASVA